jgi:sortase A
MRRDRSSWFVAALEWTLLVAGIVCLARYAWMSREVEKLESENRSAVARMLADRALHQPSALKPSALEPSALGGDPLLIGQLDIPRLRLSAAIRVGDDSDVLGGAVGYLQDTALPWEEGNTALAAHRDRLFRPLRGIRVGDDIQLSTRHGDFQYRVSRTLIVSPADVWVLNSVPGVDLTLITCYPFVYVGHAPQRFVVRARKIGLGVVRPGADVEREGDE